MKTRIVILLIVTFAFAVSLYAQDSLKKFSTNERRIAFAKKNIIMGLRSGNTGLMEASLILIAKIKMRFPEINITEVKTVVDSIAFTNSSYALQYKAYLASNICAYPEWFVIDNTLYNLETDWFFASVARRLQQKMLATEPS
ncbi:MAG: hypothetical protein Q8L88_15245 [Bacteroidota bacterium]|nr:hypothetical protein [Bacteroidota bacterium]